MNKKNKAALTALIPFLIIFSSCNIKSNKYFDYGKVENNKYSNPFIGFQIDLNPDWYYQSQETIDEINEVANNMAAGDDKELKSLIKASEITSATLLALFKHELGTPISFNANLIIVTENLKSYPGIKNGADLLYHTRNFILQSQLEYNYISENYEKVTINDVDFYIMEVIPDLNQKVEQKMYTTIKNGFGLTFILSYSDKFQFEELLNMVNTVKFTE